MTAQREPNLYGYYISFTATGDPVVDKMLEALARAAKGFHHTEGWREEWPAPDGHSGKTPVEWIQNAANEAAAEVRRLREALAPFAAIAEHFAKAGLDGRRMGGLDPEELHSFHFVPGETVALRLSDCKRAKEVLG